MTSKSAEAGIDAVDAMPATAGADTNAHLLQEAAAAADAEHQMGFWASLRLYPKAVGWSMLLSTAIVMEGYDTLLLGNLFAFPPFQRRFGVEQADGTYQLTAAWQSGLSNGALVGEILGLFVNGLVADRIGYRKTMMGALVLVAAFVFVTFFSTSLPMLLAGEILLGIPWGVFQTLTTTYAAEVCPVHLRGYLTTYVNLCWVLGQLIGSGVLRGMLARDDDWGYRIPFALQWMWPAPLLVGIAFAPESPWWLVRQGRVDEARRSLARLTSTGSATGSATAAQAAFSLDDTISMMVTTDRMEREAQAGTTYADLVRGAVSRRRTEIVCCVWIGQTLCGSSFMGYSTYFYEQAGMAVDNAFTMSLAQYAIGAVGTVSSWFLMRWFGRRTLYLAGQLAMTALLLAIGLASLAGRRDVAAQWAIGSLLLVYTFVYDCTVGPVCYSLVAELTSTRLRTKGVVMARNLYNMVGIVPNIITPHMLNPTSWDWGAKAGFFWAGSCALCALWTYFRLPEPKDRSYAELDMLFEQRVPARRFRTTSVDPFASAAARKGAQAVQAESVHVE